jgi:hypothetical protein
VINLKEFNVTGLCIPEKHYMVDVSDKLNKIYKMINKGNYFTINYARQFGKTTILNLIKNNLKNEYLVIKLSFEGIGNEPFDREENFCKTFLGLMKKQFIFSKEKDLVDFINNSNVKNFIELDLFITDLILKSNRKTILIIDEVDKSSENQLFLNFLGLIRNKYLLMQSNEDYTFYSVILAGIYDIKNIKLRIRPEDEKKYNSPWNIATDFDVELTFNSVEISTMLNEYKKDKNINVDVKKVSDFIFDFTNGYPYLVTKICKIISEKLHDLWDGESLRKSINIIVNEENSLYDDLIKNIENDKSLYSLVESISVNGIHIDYNRYEPTINKAIMFSIIKESSNKSILIHNKIYELFLYNYFITKNTLNRNFISNNYNRNQFIDNNEDLKIEYILDKFQEFMKEEYRKSNDSFLEKEGRLIFLAFLKPIINGKGFYFVESETKDNLRMDIIIVFNNKQYIIELKKWYGKENKNKGYEQLTNYLEIKGEKKGYYIVFDFRKTKKEYNKQVITKEGIEIYEVIV